MAARIVVMGVSGSGKTTVARALADALGVGFVDADDLHSPAAIGSMAAGIPLTEADRRPWLRRVAAVLAGPRPPVVACSSLSAAAREILRRAGDVAFVHLAVDPDTASRRVASRTDHFAGSDLVASQFEALDPPDLESDVVVVDATAPVASVVETALTGLGRALGDGR